MTGFYIVLGILVVSGAIGVYVWRKLNRSGKSKMEKRR